MKIGIIGAGAVGSAAAFSLMMTGVAHKVILIDANSKKAEAEAMDIAHAAPFAGAGKVRAGSYEDLIDSDVVIVTAGANQKPGETRIDLLGRNVKIFEDIIPQIKKYAPNTMMPRTSCMDLILLWRSILALAWEISLFCFSTFRLLISCCSSYSGRV